jgi:hypothetical protein
MAARKPKSNPVEEEIDIQRLRTDDEYKNQLRLRAQTDLYWLATKVLVNDQGTPSYPDINVRTHREVANFFVKKDPDKTLDEQDKVKQRLLLMPRGTFKTSFNIVDTLQWILCFPDIAIFVMTAANTDDSPLADVFLEEVARHFLNVTERDWKPLHLLFPEFVITKMPKKGWFVSPARKTYRRDATVMATSIESSLSGWHFDVIKFEDIQDNRNSQTSASIRKVKNNLFINLKMLMSWGYREGTGTRYGPMDVYGLVIERLDPRVGKVMWKPAMQVKPHVWDRHPRIAEGRLGAVLSGVPALRQTDGEPERRRKFVYDPADERRDGQLQADLPDRETDCGHARRRAHADHRDRADQLAAGDGRQRPGCRRVWRDAGQPDVYRRHRARQVDAQHHRHQDCEDGQAEHMPQDFD